MVAILKSEVSLKGLILYRLIYPTCFFPNQNTEGLRVSVKPAFFFNYIRNNMLITLNRLLEKPLNYICTLL